MLVQRVATVTRNLQGHWLGLALVVAALILNHNTKLLHGGDRIVGWLVEYVDSLPTANQDRIPAVINCG